MSKRIRILLVLAGMWAVAIALVGFRIWSVADACAQFGDLQAECRTPQGQSILRFLFIPLGVTGVILWIALSRKNKNEG